MIPESLARDMEQTINNLREDKNDTLDVLEEIYEAFGAFMGEADWAGSPLSAATISKTNESTIKADKFLKRMGRR